MTRLPPGKQWLPHCGRRQRERAMRQSLRRVEKLRDDASVAALARVRASVADDPDPGLGVMNLAHSALLAAEGVSAQGTPCTWAEAANHLLDRFAREAGGA